MTHAIGRRGRVLKRAHARAQRRFHAMFDAHVWHDPEARLTRLYVEAERLVDAVMAPEVHPTPVELVISVLSREADGFTAILGRDPIPEALDSYWNHSS